MALAEVMVTEVMEEAKAMVRVVTIEETNLSAKCSADELQPLRSDHCNEVPLTSHCEAEVEVNAKAAAKAAARARRKLLAEARMALQVAEAVDECRIKRERIEALARREAEMRLNEALPWFGPTDVTKLQRAIREARRCSLDAATVSHAERMLLDALMAQRCSGGGASTGL